MKKKYSLSDTDFEIMEVIWDSGRKEIMARDILKMMNELRGKNWKIQTMTTYLGRLVTQGMLKTEPFGRKFIYQVAVTRDSYKTWYAKFVVENLYEGSPRNFLQSLSDKKMKKKELEDLKEWISKIQTK